MTLPADKPVPVLEIWFYPRGHIAARINLDVHTDIFPEKNERNEKNDSARRYQAVIVDPATLPEHMLVSASERHGLYISHGGPLGALGAWERPDDRLFYRTGPIQDRAAFELTAGDTGYIPVSFPLFEKNEQIDMTASFNRLMADTFIFEPNGKNAAFAVHVFLKNCLGLPFPEKPAARPVFVANEVCAYKLDRIKTRQDMLFMTLENRNAGTGGF